MATYYVKTTGNGGDDSTGDGSELTPWATPGYAASQMGDGDTCYVQSGTYTLTTTTPGASGPVAFTSNYAAAMFGYETTAGDNCPNGNRPEINGGAVSFGSATGIIALDGSVNKTQIVGNIRIDGNSATNSLGIDGSSSVFDAAFNCVVTGTASYGYDFLNAVYCFADQCGTHGYNNCNTFYCRAYLNGNNGFINDEVAAHCVSYRNGVSGFQGYGCEWINCSAYDNDANDFYHQRNNYAVNCISSNAGTYAFNCSTHGWVVNCAYYNPTSGHGTANSPFVENLIALTAEPFVSPTTGDFRLNLADGGGADCRQAGLGVYDETDYALVGAVTPRYAAYLSSVIQKLRGGVT